MQKIAVSKLQSTLPYTNRSRLLLEFKESLSSICLDNKKNEFERVKLVEQIMARSTSLISLERQLKMLVDKIRYENSWLNISSGHSKLTLALTKIISKYSQETRIIYLENEIKNQNEQADTIKSIHTKEIQKIKEEHNKELKELALIITNLSAKIEQIAKINEQQIFDTSKDKQDPELSSQLGSIIFHLNRQASSTLPNNK